MVGFLVVSYTVRCGVVVLTFALPLHSSASTGNGKLEIVFLFHPGHLVVVGLLVVVVLLVVVLLYILSSSLNRHQLDLMSP